MSRPAPLTLARLAGRQIPAGVIALVPPTVRRRHRAVPLGLVAHRGRWTLVVAMAEPGNADALHELSYASGLTVQGVLADEKDILAVLERGPAAAAEPGGADVSNSRLPGWGPLFEAVEPVFATDWVI
jgi:hypothetical protein